MSHSALSNFINDGVWRIICRLAFKRVRVIGKELLPEQGCILFVATHRNGALDAAPYSITAPLAIAMVSAQLQRLPLGRFLFRGIPVARAKDKARGIKADNIRAFADCVAVLKQGKQLFILPEGTSTLGPQHLPFKKGAARIISRAMAAGATPCIVPLAVHYEAATRWQSRVEVLIGEPIVPQTSEEEMLQQMICTGLESFGANFSDWQTQEAAEILALVSSQSRGNSYALALKYFSQALSEQSKNIVQQLKSLAKQNNWFLHQGLPLLPAKSWVLSLMHWLMLAPVVFGFCVLNLPVLAAGYSASRVLPDDSNVISFWGMAVGLPVAVLWVFIFNITLLWTANPIWLGLYWIVSAIGVAGWYDFGRLSVALGNVFLRADSKADLINSYQQLFEQMEHD